MEEYSGGKIKKGSLYRVAFADIWQAKRDIANAVALPRNGMYWLHWASAEAYDEIVRLQAELTGLKTPVKTITIDMAKEYGVGVNDSTEALMRFNKNWFGRYDVHLILMFPNEFNYSNNRFMFGIVSYTAYLNGAVMKNTYSGSDEKFQRAIYASSMFHTNTMEYIGTTLYDYGSKIETAEQGSNVVKLKDHANLKVGDRALIYGYDHIIGDDPPGTKYNQWPKITSIEGNTITLSESLKHRMDENWKDSPGTTIGKPRILSLDRLDYIQPKRAEWIGGTITGSLQILGDDVLLEDLIVPDFFWPSLSKTIAAINCHFKGGTEFDKVGGSLLCYNCTFDKHVTNGTGFDFIGLYDCTFKEGYEIASREYEVIGAIVTSDWKDDVWYAPVSEPPAQSAVRKAIFAMHNITKTSDNKADTAFNLNRKKSYTVVSVQDGKIVIPYKHTEGDEWSALIRCTELGETELFTTDSRSAILINITEGENNSYIVEYDGDEFKEGDILYWYPLKEVVDLGGHNVSEDFIKGRYPQIN